MLNVLINLMATKQSTHFIRLDLFPVSTSLRGARYISMLDKSHGDKAISRFDEIASALIILFRMKIFYVPRNDD